MAIVQLVDSSGGDSVFLSIDASTRSDVLSELCAQGLLLFDQLSIKIGKIEIPLTNATMLQTQTKIIARERTEPSHELSFVESFSSEASSSRNISFEEAERDLKYLEQVDSFLDANANQDVPQESIIDNVVREEEVSDEKCAIDKEHFVEPSFTQYTADHPAISINEIFKREMSIVKGGPATLATLEANECIDSSTELRGPLVRFLCKYTRENCKRRDYPSSDEMVSSIESLRAFYPSIRTKLYVEGNKSFLRAALQNFRSYKKRRKEMTLRPYKRSNEGEGNGDKKKNKVDFNEMNLKWQLLPDRSDGAKLLEHQTREWRIQFMKSNPIEDTFKSIPKIVSDTRLIIRDAAVLCGNGVYGFKEKLAAFKASLHAHLLRTTTPELILHIQQQSTDENVLFLDEIDLALKNAAKRKKTIQSSAQSQFVLNSFEMMSVEEAMTEVKKITSQPSLLRLNGQYFLAVEGRDLPLATDFDDALQHLVCVYHVLHVEYPRQALNLFQIFNYLSEITQKKLPASVESVASL